MGRLNRAEEEASLNEALLYVTLCIIGLPVDVHVKDGSVFSGIFHTTSVDKEYGIVLKKARMTRKGKSSGAFVEGTEVETLVISSDDLVQIVVKGFVFPCDVVAGDVTGDSAEAAVGSVPSPNIPSSETKNFAKSTTDEKTVNHIRTPIQNESGSAYAFVPIKDGKENETRKLQLTHRGDDMDVKHGKRDEINIEKGQEVCDALVTTRQVGDDWSRRKLDDYKISETHKEKSADKVQGLRSSKEINGEGKVDTCHPVGRECAKMTSKLSPNGVYHDPTGVPNEPENKIYERLASTDTSPDTACSTLSISSSTNTVIGFSSITASADVNPSQKSESNRSSKEFKLNPGAKIFSPSFANPLSAAPSVTMSAANVGYMPPIVPAAAAARPEVGITAFAPRSSVPPKISAYNNLTAANSGTVSQFSQPVAGHAGGRTQPPRYATQYHPVQAGPGYVPPNSQAVMIGRFGQHVYVQQVPQDFVHGAAAISTMSGRPLLAPHQVQMPKHQGIGGQALQLCVAPPFVANGQQPFAVPSHIPLLQHPIPANTPMPLPGSNALFNNKFT
ncbi:hypothetical protein HS088_TW21G00547 [Tripterygium wilfordii]|uniref:Ataxin 2 SM domain-containing protein n=1 Tax=Tripterygium wilfordii TaxID=458696 RepID=A0A7J7C2L7_TRIWF|nr:polyadenylate-binding protein-interacting protein 4 [Tripterygium wilfordii]KAF5728400.1 hypothetical protein HS088_TW21G00547 [Tripterygium wilfordii]